ncbi:MAG: GntR family transcriptional regulator [Chloroflexota bacterium]|nr:GntR family transcriptional regulator [Chloroflexota bacterium]
MSLDRQSLTPLYLQLKDILASQVAEGLLQPGDALPSERQLCEEFNVSRSTVREALRELSDQGLLRTVPGRGAFVTVHQSNLTIRVSLAGFTGDVRRQGMTPSSRLLSAGLVASPSSAVIEAMGLQPDDELVRLERLRLVNDNPLALHIVYLNHRLCPQILQHNLAEESVFQLLRTEYGLNLAQAEEQVYATLADQREMDLLNLTHPAAVLRAERTTFLDTGEVIEFSLATYCGEWYRMSMLLEKLE